MWLFFDEPSSMSVKLTTSCYYRNNGESDELDVEQLIPAELLNEIVIFEYAQLIGLYLRCGVKGPSDSIMLYTFEAAWIVSITIRSICYITSFVIVEGYETLYLCMGFNDMMVGSTDIDKSRTLSANEQKYVPILLDVEHCLHDITREIFQRHIFKAYYMTIEGTVLGIIIRIRCT